MIQAPASQDLEDPLIGFYHWPQEIKKVKFSFIYRIGKVYFLIVYCLWKAVYLKHVEVTAHSRDCL